MNKQSAIMDDDSVWGHMCHGEKWIPWSWMLCSNCVGSKDGSYDMFLTAEEARKKASQSNRVNT